MSRAGSASESLILQMRNVRYEAPREEADPSALSKHEQAAWLVEDAFGGVFGGVDEARAKTRTQRQSYVLYENLNFPEALICVFALALVSFLEIPLWCLPNRKGVWAWEGHHALCRAPGHIYLSGIDYLPVGVTLLVEFVCVAYLAMLAGLEMGFGRLRVGASRLRVVATGLLAVDVIAFATCLVAGFAPEFRLAPYLRVALLVANVPEIYGAAEAVVVMLPKFFDVTSLLALTVVLFGWFAAITLDDYEFENREGVQVNQGFQSLGEAIYTMFFVATTADFPDQMLPSFTYDRAFGVFFAVFIIIAVFLFVELILAVVYNEYSDHVKGKISETFTNRAKGLKAAFELLSDHVADDGEHQISRESFEKLVAETNKVEKVPRVVADEVDFFFSIMDDDSSGAISKKEFYDVCNILQYSFKKVRTTSWVERTFPHLAAQDDFQAVRRFVHSPLLDAVTTGLLVVNAVVVLIESYLDLTDTLSSGGEEAFAAVEVLFSIGYMALLSAQLLVVPFDEFWLSLRNRFDFVVTVLLFATAIVWVWPTVHVSRDTLHRLTILRLLRLVSKLELLPRYRIIGECVVNMLPASVGIIGILYAAGAAWATLGVQLYGGLIYDGNEALEDTDYLDAKYDVLNCNDYAMSFISLFAFVTAGPFHEMIEAAEAVTSFPGSGYVYYISFYVVGILIVFNVFIAFVIDAFLSQYENDRVSAVDENAESLDQTMAGEGFRIVAQRGSTKDDVFRAMFLEDDD
mmetsp:Transcript_27697/g.83004  ORF Transcript_27697/g.83004 Transcript_27697/m.83004 type:complete len:746 (-) Transcript_27697:40-2277(-)